MIGRCGRRENLGWGASEGAYVKAAGVYDTIARLDVCGVAGGRVCAEDVYDQRRTCLRGVNEDFAVDVGSIASDEFPMRVEPVSK